MAYNSAPLYVKVGLFGVGSRATAMMCLWFSAAAALVATLYFENPFGPVLSLATLWYWMAVRWMDANEGWQSK